MTTALLSRPGPEPGVTGGPGDRPRPEIPEPIFGATDRRRGLITGLVIAAVAALTRFLFLGRLTDDGAPVFDEKHYVPQAWQVLTGGHWIEDNPAYGLVVHPPVGKWMIAIGEAIFGYSPWGWRFMAAVSGTVIVVLVYAVVRRMTRSTMIGAVAGLLAICDGVLFVQSRAGMLDIFQALFVVAAFTAIIADRDQMRARLHRVFREGRIDDSPFGPRLGFRWYRFTAGVMLGLAAGTKVSGLAFAAFCGLLTVGFDIANRRAYHVERPVLGVLRRDLLPAFASIGIMPVLIFLATWIPWFNSESSVYRYVVGDRIGVESEYGWLPDAVRSFWYYQSGVMEFHSGLTNSAGNEHPWESKPWTWPMGLRPMLYEISNGPDQCGGADCVRAQMLIGTPAIWWIAIPVLLWGLYRFVFRRDWRYAAVLAGYGAGFLPWWTNLDRQMYYFYATAFAPFLVMLIALACSDLLRWSGSDPARRPERRTLGLLVVAIYLGLVVANYIWLWPVLTGSPISERIWNLQIWLPSWS